MWTNLFQRVLMHFVSANITFFTISMNIHSYKCFTIYWHYPLKYSGIPPPNAEETEDYYRGYNATNVFILRYSTVFLELLRLIYACTYKYMSIYLHKYLSIYLPLQIPIYLSTFTNTYLSIYPTFNLSIYLSIYIWLSTCR